MKVIEIYDKKEFTYPTLNNYTMEGMELSLLVRFRNDLIHKTDTMNIKNVYPYIPFKQKKSKDIPLIDIDYIFPMLEYDNIIGTQPLERYLEKIEIIVNNIKNKYRSLDSEQLISLKDKLKIGDNAPTLPQLAEYFNVENPKIEISYPNEIMTIEHNDFFGVDSNKQLYIFKLK